jgi:predicted GTPase
VTCWHHHRCEPCTLSSITDGTSLIIKTSYKLHFDQQMSVLTRMANNALHSPQTLNAAKVLPALGTVASTRRWGSNAHLDDDENVIILGAAGRDFHDFITYWSKEPRVQVKCFTGTQIPGIDRRHFPADMCNNELNGNRYPNGLSIHPEHDLESLIRKYDATTCALAYSDLEYTTVQSLASRANAAGCKFVQLPPTATMLRSYKPVIAICASRTGCGKSQTTRYIANFFKEKGLKVVAVRHPMPYDKDLMKQRVQRYETLADLDKYDCTVEEREEYVGHIQEGTLLFAGVDYAAILEAAEKEADIVLWDGGNNDVPFFEPDVHICVVDSLRPKDEAHYYPGETNVRMADAILIAKVADKEVAKKHADHLRLLTKPNIPIVFGWSLISPEADGMTSEEAAALVHGKRVLVVDDGPTLTHGGVPFGAGYVLAERLGAAEIVDPRPYAHGTLQQIFESFPHLSNVLPAMGYGDAQKKELELTIQAVDCDTVVLGTPSNLNRTLDFLGKPSVVARYNLEIAPEHREIFERVLDSVVDRHYRPDNVRA